MKTYAYLILLLCIVLCNSGAMQQRVRRPRHGRVVVARDSHGKAQPQAMLVEPRTRTDHKALTRIIFILRLFHKHR